MKIVVNGDTYEHHGEGTITALLAEIWIEPDRVATVLNDSVVPKADRASIRLKEGDRVDILTFAGGG